MPRTPALLLIPLAVLASTTARSADDPPLAEYFLAEVDRITTEPLLGIDSLDQWQARRPELQRRLRSMIGLDPIPERTDLKVEIRGTVERPDFVVERLLYQSSPGLYVTANLYRPKQVDGKLPAVLYVCGHASVVQDGVIYGCKAHYQHHAAWYAANGYVCLVVDTLQLGEIPGLHHGTYREGKWWWQSLGYTPTGIEVWNAIRAVDYLQSRPEVDPDRIGVSGRSGGGAISWYLGAVDDRLAAVIPVAGITDLHDHLVEGGPTGDYPNGVVEGHCDCMYLVNTDRWDFDVVAALVAPKPLLVENTDRDPIFPEAGVRRIYEQLQKVYSWYDASDRLGLVVGEGGHQDTEEIRHPSYAFMNTWLKGEPTDPADIDEPDRHVPIELLKVLEPDEPIPADSRNASIDESFVPAAEPPPVPATESEWQILRDRWMSLLRTEVFAGWPDEDAAGPLDAEIAFEREVPVLDRRARAIDFTAQPGIRLRAYLTWPANQDAPAGPARVLVLGEDSWDDLLPWVELIEGRADDAQQDELRQLLARIEDPQSPQEILSEHPFLFLLAAAADPGPLAIVLPRGVGPSSWEDGRQDTHIRRRFALLGQTLDGMRAFDVRRALGALASPEAGLGAESPRFVLYARGEAVPVALWAAVFEPEDSVVMVALFDPPSSIRDGPAFLNLSRVLDPPQAVALLGPRLVLIQGDEPGAYSWVIEAARSLGTGLLPRIVGLEAP
ncbi:alpha/beta hydrolase family protein [Tautonia sociabilis]|uniref:Acetylxylan esterase n=1 Tax=Tautonia sociabilis TaxID=2080755 RepID=A0A432MHC5_9BACT|nr:acetylxylan esterase [Tautonia sociabilis]RUL86206.1 acetylxylan esterase [Tautonia sociabilis]